jgi:hypothetical protein
MGTLVAQIITNQLAPVKLSLAAIFLEKPWMDVGSLPSLKYDTTPHRSESSFGGHITPFNANSVSGRLAQ